MGFQKNNMGGKALWLCECLDAYTAHFCKATLLSRLAKSRTFAMEEKQAMRHHSHCSSASTLICGRQFMFFSLDAQPSYCSGSSGMNKR